MCVAHSVGSLKTSSTDKCLSVETLTNMPPDDGPAFFPQNPHGCREVHDSSDPSMIGNGFVLLGGGFWRTHP